MPKKSHAAPRDRLLDTAKVLFLRDGVPQTGINTVTAEAGVARMTLYNNFASKDDLVLTVFEREAELRRAANAPGYIFGALATFALIGPIKAPTLFILGLLVTSLSLLVIGFGSSFWYLTFWWIAAGVAGAPVFIAGGALSSLV